MHFNLIDRVLELDARAGSERIVTLKHVSSAEEYLQDHFPTFPVLPGVMMLESMVQAGRELAERAGVAGGPHVLGLVRALKYGAFVKPGSSIRVEVTLHKRLESDGAEFKGEVFLVDPGRPVDAGEGGSGGGGGGGGEVTLPVACSGRFVLRPVRLRVPMALG